MRVATIQRAGRRPRVRGIVLRTLACLAVIGTAAGSNQATLADGGRPVGNRSALADWRLMWSDDFAGPARTLPSSGNWIFDLGRSYPGEQPGWGTGEIETYTKDLRNISLDGAGNLVLTATRDAAGQWRSARIETRRADFQPPSGGSLKIEARIQLPDGGQGYWPAFWALGAPFRQRHVWPGAGEIDAMENVDNQPEVHGTLHCGTVASGGPCHEDTGLTGTYPLPGPAGTVGFHTYAVVWSSNPRQLSWLVDGRPYWTVTPAMTGEATWAATFGHGYFLLLNLAIGGGWPGNPDASTRPDQSMLVDYLAVYRSGTG